MKIYTATYEATKPSPQAIDVPLNSDYGIAVGLTLNGNKIPLTENDVKLGELSANRTLDGMAVFDMNSDGVEGREAYKVSTKTDGIDVVDGSAYAETPILPNPAMTTLICDLSHLAGKEWEKPVITTDEEMLLAPFNLRVYNSEGEMQSTTGNPDIYIFIDDGDGTPDPDDAPYWKMKYRKTGSTYRVTWQKVNADHTGWENTDEPLVIPENAYAQSTYTFAAVLDTGKIVFDIQHHQMLKRQFQLYVDKKDMGYAEEGAVFPDYGSITLSGTYSDDTPFSFDVLTTED